MPRRESPTLVPPLGGQRLEASARALLDHLARELAAGPLPLEIDESLRKACEGPSSEA